MELRERIRPLCALAISRAIYNASGLADGLILLTGIRGKGRPAQGVMVEELLDRHGNGIFCERGRGRYTRRWFLFIAESHVLPKIYTVLGQSL